MGLIVIPGVAEVDQELAGAAVPILRRFRLAKQDHVVGDVRVGGPHLGAVDHEAAVDRLGAGASRRKVRPRVRLRHADAEVALPGGDPGQDLLPLRLGAVLQQQRAGLAVGDPMQPHRRPGGQHLLAHHVAFQGAAPAAAIARRECHAEVAGRTACAGERRVVAHPRADALARAVAADGVGEEGAHLGAQRVEGVVADGRGECDLVHSAQASITALGAGAARSSAVTIGQ